MSNIFYRRGIYRDHFSSRLPYILPLFLNQVCRSIRSTLAPLFLTQVKVNNTASFGVTSIEYFTRCSSRPGAFFCKVFADITVPSICCASCGQAEKTSGKLSKIVYINVWKKNADVKLTWVKGGDIYCCNFGVFCKRKKKQALVHWPFVFIE